MATQTPHHHFSCPKTNHQSSYKTLSSIISYNLYLPRSSRLVCTKTRASSNETLYEVLGISESCEGTSSEDIKKAYRNMARKYHPDVSPPERVHEYTKKFILLHEAYQTLSDPHSRALYDRDLSKFSHQEEEWRIQLHGLKTRSSNNCRRHVSWGARMRDQRSSP